jgi:hypothetical protein
METPPLKAQTGREVHDDKYRQLQREVVKLTLLHSPELVNMIRAELQQENSAFNDPTKPGGSDTATPDPAQGKGNQLSRVVGDPTERAALDDYISEVDAIIHDFRIARRAAWLTTAKAGRLRQQGPVLAYKTLTCYRSLFCLKTAGWLYRMRIQAVINVDRHAEVLNQAFAVQPAPSS